MKKTTVTFTGTYGNKFNVWFEGGSSRCVNPDSDIILNYEEIPEDYKPGDIPVNYMLCKAEIETEDEENDEYDCEEVELYAEWYATCDDPEEAGYEELKAEIIRQAREAGIDPELLHFYWD